MRLTRTRLRIAALAGATALAASWGAVAVPAAQAATIHTICNKADSSYCLNYEGSKDFVVADTEGSDYYEYEVVNSNGVPTGVCLQDNVAETTLAFGGCAQNPRQFFWYDNATLLVNPAYNEEAYINVSGNIALGSFGGSWPDDSWSISG